MHIAILLSGLRGRELYSDDWPRTPIRVSGSPAHIEEFPYAADLPRDELVAEAGRLALQRAEDLSRRFRWEPTPGVLQRARMIFSASRVIKHNPDVIESAGWLIDVLRVELAAD